jgi:hypothetical protein
MTKLLGGQKLSPPAAASVSKLAGNGSTHTWRRYESSQHICVQKKARRRAIARQALDYALYEYGQARQLACQERESVVVFVRTVRAGLEDAAKGYSRRLFGPHTGMGYFRPPVCARTTACQFASEKLPSPDSSR